MNFLNPAFLFGLLAASVPILLHLINLRKREKIEFSTLRFLKELEKTKIKSVKIKNLILLILRVLIVTFLVLAFSRPVTNSALPGFSTNASVSKVILIDNTASMDLNDSYGNRLRQSKAIVNSLIEKMGSSDEATIIPLAGDYLIDELSTNIENLLKFNNQINVNLEKVTDISEHLKLAENILSTASNTNKQIILISDFQKNNFNIDSLKANDKNTLLTLVQVGADSEPLGVNLSIDTVLTNNTIIQIGKELDFEVKVSNNSKSNAVGVPISMVVEGRRLAQRNISLEADKSAYVTFTYKVDKIGNQSILFKLEPDESILDNQYHIGLNIPSKPDIAVFTDMNNKTFIEALAKRAIDEDLANVEVLPTQSLATINFNDVSLVVLASGNYSKDNLEMLKNYISQGGNALIYYSYQVDENVMTKFATELGLGNPKIRNYKNENISINDVDLEHQFFEGVFKQSSQNRAEIDKFKVSEILTIDNLPQSIIRIDGEAILTLSSLGKGKFAFCALSSDLYSGTFPLSGLFPVVFYKSISYLSASGNLGQNFDYANANGIYISPLYSNINKFKVNQPDSVITDINGANLPTGVYLSPLYSSALGIYKISTSKNEDISTYSVNHHYLESYQNFLTKEEIEEIFKDYTNFYIKSTDNLEESMKSANLGTELWLLFLILATLAAIAESIIGKNTKNEL